MGRDDMVEFAGETAEKWTALDIEKKNMVSWCEHMRNVNSSKLRLKRFERTTQTTTWNMYSFHPGAPQGVGFPGVILNQLTLQ